MTTQRPDETCEICARGAEPTEVTRRAFIKGSVAVVSVGMAMPSVFSRTVRTASTSKMAGGTFQDSGKVLIVVQMAGGNDGLNTVVPFADPKLATLRPTLITREQDLAFKLNGSLGLHPGLAAFKPLWDAGDLAVVSNVGYPDPSLSHFQSMDIWETMDPQERQGWLGRYLAGLIDRDGHPLAGIDITTALSPALNALSAPVATMSSPQSFSLVGAGESPGQTALLAATLDRIYRAYPKAAPYAALLAQTEQNSFSAAKLLTKVGGAYQPKATYPPGPFGNGYIAATFCPIGSIRLLYGATFSRLKGTGPAGAPPNAFATLSCCNAFAQTPLALKPAVQFSEKSPIRCFAVGTTDVIGMPCRIFSPS